MALVRLIHSSKLICWNISFGTPFSKLATWSSSFLRNEVQEYKKMQGLYNFSTKLSVLLKESTGLCKENHKFGEKCSVIRIPQWTFGETLSLLHPLSYSLQTTLSVVCFILKHSFIKQWFSSLKQLPQYFSILNCILIVNKSCIHTSQYWIFFFFFLRDVFAATKTG